MMPVGATRTDGRRQPGDHALAQHGHHRLDDRRRRPRLRRARRAPPSRYRRRHRGRVRDRRARHRARPAEPGLRGEWRSAQPACRWCAERAFLSAVSQSHHGGCDRRHQPGSPVLFMRPCRPIPQPGRSRPEASGRGSSAGSTSTSSTRSTPSSRRCSSTSSFRSSASSASCRGLGSWPDWALAGFALGGIRLAILTVVLAFLIAVTGQWEKAMITVYLCGISVVIACLIGVPIGDLGGRATALGASCRRSSTRCRPCRASSI